MGIETQLMIAIQDRIASPSGATLRGLVNDYGRDMIPAGTSPPYLTWRTEDGEEWDFMTPGTDYYLDIPVVFTVGSADKSRTEAINIREQCAALFRNAFTMRITDARILDITAVSSGTTEDPNAGGFISWQIFLFRIGTT